MRIHISTAVTLCAAAIFFLPSAAGGQRGSRSRTINAEGLFTFRLPVGFKESEMGIDIFMRGYERGRARFLFVCGDSASSEYDEKKVLHAHETWTTIDGKRASIRTFIYRWTRTPVYVTELNVGDWCADQVELYMGMESPNRADVQMAQRIFRSVKFLKSGCA